MVVWLYNIYAEDEMKQYLKERMWVATEKLATRPRAFPFFVLAAQATFSIRTLKLFDPDAKVEIRTNNPKHNYLQYLQNNFSNITVVNTKPLYDEYKDKSFWNYRIRYEALLDMKEDTIMIDCDTYFTAKPTFELNDNTCWVSHGGNMGILGLTRKNIQAHIPSVIQKIDEEADPEGKEKRAIDETITLTRMKNNNIKCEMTGKWIHHYYQYPHNEKLKWSAPTEDLFEKLKKKKHV